MKAKEMETKLI